MGEENGVGGEKRSSCERAKSNYEREIGERGRQLRVYGLCGCDSSDLTVWNDIFKSVIQNHCWLVIQLGSDKQHWFLKPTVLSILVSV